MKAKATQHQLLRASSLRALGSGLLFPLLLASPILLSLPSPALCNTSTKAEKRRYTSADVPDGGPRFEDYHQLLDHYYTAGMTEEELYDSLRETMTYRLSLPQRYYEGAGYIPGVDEGTLPTVSDGKGGRREMTEEEYWRHRKNDEKKVKQGGEKRTGTKKEKKRDAR